LSRSQGSLFVLAGPSGAGKTTLSHHLVDRFDQARFSVSATTRKPRGNERDGVDYLFLSEEDFNSRIDSGFFLEYASVHGHLYGTSREWVSKQLADGRSVILDIDVQGALQVKEAMPSSVLIFILPPDPEELRKRLRSRNTDDEETVSRRMEAAAWESSWIGSFDYFIRNDDLKSSLADVEAIYRGRDLRVEQMPFPREVQALSPGCFAGVGHWSGKRVVVTSGPTRESIDAVRFISNRSSGLMGRSLASAFRDAGSSVVFVTGPACHPPPQGVECVRVETAAEMLSAVSGAVEESTDLLVMAAAVSDFAPEDMLEGKIGRSGVLELKLETTPDILKTVKGLIPEGCSVLAFALEFGPDGRRRAMEKLERKGATAIFLNPGDTPGAGMESGANMGELLFSDGSSIKMDSASKLYLANLIAAAMGRYLQEKGR
jgi:guanylate kinase